MCYSFYNSNANHYRHACVYWHCSHRAGKKKERLLNEFSFIFMCLSVMIRNSYCNSCGAAFFISPQPIHFIWWIERKWRRSEKKTKRRISLYWDIFWCTNVACKGKGDSNYSHRWKKKWNNRCKMIPWFGNEAKVSHQFQQMYKDFNLFRASFVAEPFLKAAPQTENTNLKEWLIQFGRNFFNFLI